MLPTAVCRANGVLGWSGSLMSSSFMVIILSWFYGHFPLGKLVSGLLPAGGEGGLDEYSPLGERVGLWLLPTGEVGFMVTSCWRGWFQGYSHWGRGWVACVLPTPGEGGLHCYFALGKLVFGYFLLGKLVSGLLPAWGRGWVACVLPTGGEGGLYGYFPLGKLVYGFFPLGKLVSGLLPAGGESGLHEYPTGGEGGLHEYSCWGRGWAAWLLPAGGVG